MNDFFHVEADFGLLRVSILGMAIAKRACDAGSVRGILKSQERVVLGCIDPFHRTGVDTEISCGRHQLPQSDVRLMRPPDFEAMVMVLNESEDDLPISRKGFDCDVARLGNGFQKPIQILRIQLPDARKNHHVGAVLGLRLPPGDRRELGFDLWIGDDDKPPRLEAETAGG